METPVDSIGHKPTVALSVLGVEFLDHKQGSPENHGG